MQLELYQLPFKPVDLGREGSSYVMLKELSFIGMVSAVVKPQVDIAYHTTPPGAVVESVECRPQVREIGQFNLLVESNQ